MRIIIATLFLTLTLHASERIDVPRATAPKIDGTHSAGEWKDASRVPLQGGGEAFLKHDGTFLYIALEGPRKGIGSLCTLAGDSIRIIHASGALGTAEFTREGKVTRGFTWTNRDTGESAEAMAERKKFLEAENWFGNATHISVPSSTREFQIAIEGRREIPFTLGFMSFTNRDDHTMHVWPAKLSDACADVRLAGGWTEGTFTFDPKQWGTLVLGEQRD